MSYNTAELTTHTFTAAVRIRRSHTAPRFTPSTLRRQAPIPGERVLMGLMFSFGTTCSLTRLVLAHGVSAWFFFLEQRCWPQESRFEGRHGWLWGDSREHVRDQNGIGGGGEERSFVCVLYEYDY